MTPILAALLPLAIQVGAPMVQQILEGKIGKGNTALAGALAKTVAEQAGVLPEDLPALAEADPDTVSLAIESAERTAPALVALYSSGLEHQTALMLAEQKEPWWAWAWRPGMMYLFAFLWLWNIVGLHVINAVFKIALPQTDLVLLFQLNGLYMALYMGGHTIKDTVTKVAERFRPR